MPVVVKEAFQHDLDSGDQRKCFSGDLNGFYFVGFGLFEMG